MDQGSGSRFEIRPNTLGGTSYFLEDRKGYELKQHVSIAAESTTGPSEVKKGKNRSALHKLNLQPGAKHPVCLERITSRMKIVNKSV